MTSLRNRKVLIVDDNPDTCELLRAVLEQSGASVVVTDSVAHALWEFRRSPAHAVVTDIRLGEADGYELLKAIRKWNAEYRGVTPVVALTGYASPEDEARAFAAGFTAYFYKPCNPMDVVDAVGSALRGPADLAA
jgi:CheY-like chemotaxis protein